MLSVDSELHYRVFQTMLIFCGDYELRLHASCIFALLLYDQQLSTSTSVGEDGSSKSSVENLLVMERLILP